MRFPRIPVGAQFWKSGVDKAAERMSRLRGDIQHTFGSEYNNIVKKTIKGENFQKEVVDRLEEKVPDHIANLVDQSLAEGMNIKPRSWFARHKILTGLGALGGGAALYNLAKDDVPGATSNGGPSAAMMGAGAAEQVFQANLEQAAMREQNQRQMGSSPSAIAAGLGFPDTRMNAGSMAYDGRMAPGMALQQG